MRNRLALFALVAWLAFPTTQAAPAPTDAEAAAALQAAVALENAGRWLEAITAYRVVETAARRTTEDHLLGISLHGQARCRIQLHEPDLALPLLTEAIGAFRRSRDDGSAAEAEADLGATLFSLGRGADAVHAAERSAQLIEHTTNPATRLRVLQNLSIILAANGSHARALRIAELAAATAMADGAGEVPFPVLATLNDALLRVGRLEECAQGWEALLRSSRVLEPDQRAQAYGARGQCLAQLGETEAAIEALRAAERAYLELGAIDQLLIVRISIANTLRLAARPTESLEVATACASQARSSPALRPYADFELGASQVELGQFEPGQQILAQVANDARRAGNQDLLVAALAHEAIALGRLGRDSDARERCRMALEVVSTTTAGLSDDLSVVGRAQRASIARTYVAAARHGGAEELATAIERCRALALLSSIGGKRAADGTDRTEALQALAASAKQAADDLARDVAQHSEAGDLRGDALSALKRRASDAVAAADAARERVQRERGLHAATVPTAFASPADVAGMLRPDQVFVSICTLDDQAFALIVEHGRSDVRYVELGESRKFVAQCEDVREAALNEEPRAVAVAKTAGDALLARLALPPSTTSIVLSVDAELADVPFGALVAAGPTPIAVVMAPSATVWQALRAYPVVKDRPALVAGISDYGFEYADTTRRVYLGGGRLASLPTAVTEANAAAGATGVLLANERATEPAVRTAMQDEAGWDAVHVVCHGVIHPRVPALSGLALRPAGTDDGFFDVREVLDLRVRTNLVVLAACQTGLGKVYAGEGIWGLGRAFMLAGAPRVLVSLWKVDDAATTELMSAFHDGRRAGLGAADALRRAQEHVRETPGWTHPRYWAAWQLWGLPD